MFTFYMDSQGIILFHAVPSKTKVNADYYSKVTIMTAKRKADNDMLLIHMYKAAHVRLLIGRSMK